MKVDDQSGIVVATGVRSETYGGPDGYKTVLTINSAFPAIAGGAALGVGKLLMTLPSVESIISGSSINVAVKETQGNVTADTPDIGIGTTIASGVISVLGGTAAFENILTGQTAADCDGTATVETVTTALALTTGGVAKTIYLNIADGWAASGDAAAVISGTVTIWWRPV